MNVKNLQHPAAVLRDLNGMRERSELTDVILEVEGKTFPCHRAVLASCSPYFRTMFTSGYAEAKQGSVCIQDVTEVAMATILDYAYTGCLKTEPDQVQAVMSAARLLQVDFVFCKTAEYMKDHLDVSNCADVMMYADMMGDLTLQEASGKYVASRFNQVALQPSFLQLSLPQLQSLINRDDLICSEDDVVQAALRWTEFDQERLQHLPALSKSFRHSLISTSVIAELESKCPTTGKLVYSNSTDKRLGEMKTETLIFFRKEIHPMELLDSRDLTEPSPCYDPSTKKLHMMTLPDNLESFSMAVTSEDELYLAGCVSFRNDLRMLKTKNTFVLYNHLLSTWEPRCDMISPRVRCGLVYLKGYIYAIGGDDTKKSAERYDPRCDKWTSVAPIPGDMASELCVVALDDSIYVISKAGCYRYIATENVWSKMADMLTPPSRPQAVMFQGYIYCVDSATILGESACVEVYKPKNNTWKRTSGERSFPFFHFAILMPSMGSLHLLIPEVFTDRNSYSSGASAKATRINIYQYQPEEDRWLVPENPETIIPPIRWWLQVNRRTDCLVARMIPKCLGDGSMCKDGQEYCEDGELSEIYCEGSSWDENSSEYIESEDDEEDTYDEDDEW